MAWTFLDGTKFTTPSNRFMAFDGASMWVSTGTSINVYDFWGEGDGVSNTIDLSLHLSSTDHILKVFDVMYVFNTAVSKFTKIDITTKEILGTITIPESTSCVPAYGNDKIWFVTDVSIDTQYLYYYNITTNQWSTPVAIPGRHQTTNRKIIWGRSNFIFVLGANESSVSKFNGETGAYITQIVTNRAPANSSHIETNDNNEILISGFNGMLSSVNQDTNTSTNVSGLGATTQNFIDDGTYLWTVTPSAARITKNTEIDNYILMKSIPSVAGEEHSSVFYGFGFSLDNQDITSLSNVKQGSTLLFEGTDYIFEVQDAFAEQRLTILRDAPNIVGSEPFTITVDYSYTPQLKDFEITGFTDTTFIQVLNTPQYTHNYWDDNTMTIKTKTEPQRIVLLADTAIYFAYNLADSWSLEDLRAYELTIKGTALVGTGQTTYHGETT